MTRFFLAGLLLTCLMLLPGCGGASTATTTTPTSTIPQVAGSWEIKMQSVEQPGYSTLIETNMQQSTGTLSASGGNQIVLIGVHPAGGLYFGGNCLPVGTDSFTGTVEIGNTITITLTENATVYALTGTVTGTGNTMTGTYTFTSGTCNDSGTFVGQQVGQIEGTYAGTLDLANASDSASAVMAEVPGGFTETLTLTGVDNETDSLTGFVVGNLFSVQGTVEGQSVTYYGYHNPGESDVYMVDATSGNLLGVLRAP
jgi:hypothetical protein